MAVVVTSFTPTTGTEDGGTQVVITGTGLDTADVVLVGNTEGHIVAQSALSLTFTTPGGAIGAHPVTVVDVGGDSSDTGGNFTYTAATVDEKMATTLASKWALDVREVGDSTWIRVRGVKSGVKPALDYTDEDDSDTDTGIDGATLIVGRSASVTCQVKRGKGITSGDYDAGQEVIRLAAEAAGTAAGTIEIRFYDRTGGPEAYEAISLAKWSPVGGNKTGDLADVTLPIQGARTVVANPVIADSALSNGLYTP